MRRLLLSVVALVGLGVGLARADSTVPALAAATSLLTSTTYLAQGGTTDTKIGYTTSVFDIAAGALTLKAGGVSNAMLANAATTANGQTCTLGSTCTITVPISTGVSGLGASVATALANQLNTANGPIGALTPTLNNCAVGNGSAWTSAACPAGTAANPTATISGSAVNGVATTFMRSDAAPALATTAVTPGSYTNTNLTVDANGRITAASNGSPSSATGFGVDSGTAAVTITASCTLGTTAACVSHSIRQVNVGSLAGAITITLDAITNVASDSCVRIDDAANNIGATNTLTVTANAADSINGGSTGGSVGPYSTAGSGLLFCVSATHNWNMLVNTTTPAPGASQILTSTSGSVPAWITAGTGVLTALANAINANGGFLTASTAAIASNAIVTGAGSGTALTGTTPGTGVLTALGTAVNTNGGPLTASTAAIAANAIVTGAGSGTALTGTTPGTGVLTALAANLSANGGLTTTIASGSKALGTGAISSGTCATVVTDTATNTATTDVVLASFNGDPTAVTGYVPATTGMLTIISYPTANTVNFKVCNNTSASITPGAITLNWRVVR